MPRLLPLLVVLFASSAVLSAQEIGLRVKPPATGATAGPLAAQRAIQRRDWLVRTVGKPFEERAKGQPWEAEGKAFVAEAFARWMPRSIYENDAELAERGRHVREDLKCEDPLVRCLYARLAQRASYDAFWHWQGIADQVGLFRADYLVALGRIERTLNELEKLGTPRGFLAAVASESAWRAAQAGRQESAVDLRNRAIGWLRKSLSDGSYVIPGADEELLIEDAINDAGARGLSTWSNDFRAEVEKAPLSEWARLTLLGGCEVAELVRRKRGGGEDLDYTPALTKFVRAWELHPSAPEPPQRVLTYSWLRPPPTGTTLQDWLDRAVAAQFDNYIPYDTVTSWLRPDWVGSVAEEEAFGRSCVATRRFDTAVPLYYMDVLKTLCLTKPWRAICRRPENAAALLALGRGMVAEPSRQDEKWRWKSLAAVWAWFGGNDREAADALASLPAEGLHPIALQELRHFRTSPTIMQAELAIRLSSARDDYEKGEALYWAFEPGQAQEAFAAALKKYTGDAAGRQWLESRVALADFEVASQKGEWMKVPLDLRQWDVLAGKWSNTADGALVLESDGRPVFARFRPRLGVDWEMRGEFSVEAPGDAAHHAELGIAFRTRGAHTFLQCLLREEGSEFHLRFLQGVFQPPTSKNVPKLPPEGSAPLRPANRFLFLTSARHLTLELNGAKIWDNVENKTGNLAGDNARIGFAAREPAAGTRTTIRSLEIRRLPSTMIGREKMPPDPQ